VKDSVRVLQEKRGGERQLDHLEADHIVVASAIPRSNWTLVEITPYEELTKTSRLMASILAMIGFASIGIAFVGTWFLTKKFTDPIIFLTKVLAKYPQKKVSEELPYDYNNEFGLLFNGYRDLMHRSDRLYESLIKQHSRQREAEMKALQANINPHFLYNTLDQLNWSAIERGDEEMSRMLELLGNMLRIGLSRGESILTIDDELTYLKYYMQIQEIQMEGRLTYSIDVPSTIRSYYIPKLTFQPFVENAIIHGFHEQREGHISLTGKEYEEYIVFHIADNGLGMKKDLHIQAKNKPKLDTGGYGIRNVGERLDIYFSEKASVNVTNRKEGGVVVSIRLPKIISKDQMQCRSVIIEGNL
jgi:two-component system sensor histidine kinase YesM